jgi:hypothetical protein
MPKRPCPICGDPNAFPFWVSEEPPDFCPQDPSVHRGGPASIRNVTECKYQMGKARQRAEWMRLFPEQFDENGKLKEGGLVHILTHWKPPEGTELIV